ncbi:uncharacterized protein At4g02000-like [Brassica napus]|uniref:uncharacterized protein At4g02000-like n=1 Tax=Brassica napus TaxID=3708 RepID=UPI00207AE443|nr:uncharacterized protein At4g02000-like [Brassica napus]
MADKLHNAIRSLSIEDDDPVTLPDDPKFRVFDANATSLMGRLLNPDCQPMAKMINYMPTAWRVHGRVRGIALSRDRFQFIFQREEDLLTVLKDRPWSYNHWTMLLERWTPNPPASFLTSLDVWIRIRNIPVNYYTSDTMYALAKKIGRVVELAYDPKVSQTTDYVRAKVCFNVENPALEAKNLIIPEEVVVIKYEYEKIHKRCFSCLRLTHEKAHCPFLKRAQANRGGTSKEGEAIRNTQIPALLAAPLESPPGFPTMFPELSKEDRQAAMMYVSHADETERRARILRVQHSIENAKDDDTSVPIRISHNLNKDKGLVFGYSHGDDSNSESNNTSTLHAVSAPALLKDKEDRAATSGEQSASSNFQINGSTVFRLGNTTSSGYTGTWRSKRIDRKRPPAWVRRVRTNRYGAGVIAVSQGAVQPMEGSGKRKPEDNKGQSSDYVGAEGSKKPNTNKISVASSLKPLPSQ